jgi:peroxiredoxin
MVKTASTMLPLGSAAPKFSLTNTDGKTITLESFPNDLPLLVIFMCNHCPFVIHLRDHLVKFIREYQDKGISVVAISSNDAEKYPADSPEKMKEDAEKYGYTFPYLYDETQDAAKAYRAACTPDFFLFDRHRQLVYRGQYDDSRPSNGQPVTGADLKAACDAVLSGQSINALQRPSIGCNIKWKPGQEPDYFTGISAV